MEKSHRGILAALSTRKGGLLEGGLRIGVKNGKIFFQKLSVVWWGGGVENSRFFIKFQKYSGK